MRVDYDSQADTLAIELIDAEGADYGDDETHPHAVVAILGRNRSRSTYLARAPGWTGRSPRSPPDMASTPKDLSPPPGQRSPPRTARSGSRSPPASRRERETHAG